MIRFLSFKSVNAVAALALIVASQVARADVPGVFSDRIVLGQSAAFEGAASAQGNGVRLGLQAALVEVNRDGGVAGRNIKFLVHYRY